MKRQAEKALPSARLARAEALTNEALVAAAEAGADAAVLDHLLDALRLLAGKTENSAPANDEED